MTLAVELGRKATKQTNKQQIYVNETIMSVLKMQEMSLSQTTDQTMALRGRDTEQKPLTLKQEQSNQPTSLPKRVDCKTRKDTDNYISKQGLNINK